MAMPNEEDVPSRREATAAPPVQPRGWAWRPSCVCCLARGWRTRCRCSGTIVPVDIPADGAGGRTLAQDSTSGSISAGTDAGPKPSWGSSMLVLQLTGKFKRGNLLRRREKQNLKPKPKAAIGMLNELAALSSRDQADELYIKELQCARQRRLSLIFCDARFERKYVDYHHDNWSLSALRERLLKFLGAFVFFAAFEDVLSSLRDDSVAKKLVAYAIILAAFFGCYALNEALQWLETRPSTDGSAVMLRLPLHAAFSVVWSFALMGMAIHFEEIRYLSALLMPLLYGHSILHFHWLGCIYLLVAVIFEFVWVFLLDGWNSELDISTRAHSLHGVLIMSASLFMFVKYVCEQGSREHFRLVKVIELRKQQSIRGNALAQKLIANILPPFIVPQLRVHPWLAGQNLRVGPTSDTSNMSYKPPKRGQVIAHSYSSISVLFATVLVEPAENSVISSSSNADDFTESAQLERVLLLDQVFSMFDRLLDLPTLPQRPTASKESPRAGHDLTPSSLMRRVRPVNTTAHTDLSMYEKIKTIGNTYMVAAGIPHDTDCGGNSGVPQHAEAAVALACKMQQAVASFNTEPEQQSTGQKGSQVLLRVGIHSGTITAGVIGIKKYCFDIWGDTVNVASRMDATGIPGRIQLSATTRQMLPGVALTLDGTNSVEFEARGPVDVKGKGPMETFLVAEKSRSGQHQAKEDLLQSATSSCTVVAVSSSQGSTNGDAVDKRVPTSSRLQVPLQPYSLAFESSASETAFQEEYANTNLRVANASVVLVILFLLVLVCLTGCWFWLRSLVTKVTGKYLGNDGSGTFFEDDSEREMQLAWLIVVGNTLLSVILVVQLQYSARTHDMQRRLGTFSVIAILIIFAMNVAADLIGYSQLLETPYILSGLIYVFFLSKLLVARAATISWTWLLIHTVYRSSATGLHSLFYAQFGSPLFLCAMTMMLHVLAYDNECKVRQGHWLRNMANAQSLRLLDARAVSDALLENCLPKSVISDALRSAEVTSSDADHANARTFEVHREVTVLFVDIVNFTKLSAGMKPADLVSLLHDLVSQIDQLVGQYPVEKIKTIGDAYMVASGLPECRDDHAEAVAEFALDLLDIVSRFNTSNRQVPHLNRPHIAVRAGIDTGPAIAGIIGDKKFCYDIWGAGVDGAIAMEQSGVANRIHLSQAAANRLGGLYHMDLRKHTLQMKQTKSTTKANLPVKLGVQTFFLTGRSKRVDFTRKAATSSRESARWDDRATKSLPGKRDDKGDQVSRGAISLGAANEVAPPPSRQPSVRVERHRRQSSTW